MPQCMELKRTKYQNDLVLIARSISVQSKYVHQFLFDMNLIEIKLQFLSNLISFYLSELNKNTSKYTSSIPTSILAIKFLSFASKFIPSCLVIGLCMSIFSLIFRWDD